MEPSSVDPYPETLPGAAGETADAQDEGLIGALDILVPLIRRRRLILICTVLGLLLGMLWTLRKGIYVSTVTVLPPQSSVSSSLMGQIGNLAGLIGGAGLGGSSGSQDLYVSLMQSPSVQDAVIHRFGLRKVYEEDSEAAARGALSKHSVISPSPRDGLIRLTITDPDDPKRAAAIANGYVDEFMKFMSHLAVGEAAQRRLFFEQQMQKEKNDLAEAENNMAKLQQKNGTVQLDAQTRAMVETVSSLRAQVAAKQVQVESIRAYAGPDNINLQRAEQELSALRAQLARLATSGTPVGDDMAVSRKELPQTTLDYIRAQRDVKYHEAIFSILANQYEAARLDEAREGAPVQIVEPATPPEGRSATPAWRKLMAGALFGFFAASFYVLVVYAWERMRANPLFADKLMQLRHESARRV